MDRDTLKKHIIAAELLDKIKDAAFKFIASTPGVNEYQVHRFILKQYKLRGMVTDENRTIVGFDANSAQPHYYPRKNSSATLKPGTFILIDIWARLAEKGAPYADITWVGFYAAPQSKRKVPKEIAKQVALTFKARDNALAYLKKQLAKGIMPTGREIDSACYTPIVKAGYLKNIMHTTGHAIGYDSPHGKEQAISQKGFNPLLPNLAYTIEPGVYFPKKFGVRSEIDFYITAQKKLIITTPVQTKLVLLK